MTPPPTRYGRLARGYRFRSTTSAGKTSTYEKVVVEMTRPSTIVKKLFRLPPEIRKFRIRKRLARIPETTFTGTGVPNRLEKYPMDRGPDPASAPIAIRRSDAISQTTPLESRAKTTPAPTRPFRMLAAVVPSAWLTTVW